VHFNHQHARRVTTANEPALQAECELIHAKRGRNCYQRGTKESLVTQTVTSQKHVAICWHKIPSLSWE